MSEDMASERLVVLVVDDAPSSLALLCRMLEDAGYTVLVASDGEMALERLRLVVPDAILLDAMMPGMSGSAVADAGAYSTIQPRWVFPARRWRAGLYRQESGAHWRGRNHVAG